MSIKLQGIPGLLKSVSTSELKPGDIIIWNYGYKSKVISIMPSKTNKTYIVTLESLEDHVLRQRTILADTQLAIDDKKKA